MPTNEGERKMTEIKDMTDEELHKVMEEYDGEIVEDSYWEALCEEFERRGLGKTKEEIETEQFESEVKRLIFQVNHLRKLEIPLAEKIQILKKTTREMFTCMKPFLKKRR